MFFVYTVYEAKLMTSSQLIYALYVIYSTSAYFLLGFFKCFTLTVLTFFFHLFFFYVVYSSYVYHFNFIVFFCISEKRLQIQFFFICEIHVCHL